MGKVRQGSGVSEWVAVYNDDVLVKFGAMWAEITYSGKDRPSLKAIVHQQYWERRAIEYLIDFILRQLQQSG